MSALAKSDALDAALPHTAELLRGHENQHPPLVLWRRERIPLLDCVSCAQFCHYKHFFRIFRSSGILVSQVPDAADCSHH